MPALIANSTAVGTGGAVFIAPEDPSRPITNGEAFLLVGDSAFCPTDDEISTILPLGSSASMKVNGIPVAMVGSQTTCGHPVGTPGTNTSVTSVPLA